MARDRDHVRVAAQAREDAARLRKAWDNYVAAGKALADVRQCDSVWPSSVADVAPTRCQLLHAHAGEHRHRMLGTSVAVTW